MGYKPFEDVTNVQVSTILARCSAHTTYKRLFLVRRCFFGAHKHFLLSAHAQDAGHSQN